MLNPGVFAEPKISNAPNPVHDAREEHVRVSCTVPIWTELALAEGGKRNKQRDAKATSKLAERNEYLVMSFS